MGIWSSGRREALPWVLLVAVALVAGLPATSLPFGGDDQYILARANAPDLRDRLAVYTVDVPGPLGQRIGAWWMGLEYRRHFVRIPPSLALSTERFVFGLAPRPYHVVSLLLHALNALLLYALLRRLALPGALIAAMLFAAHPAIYEMVSWLAVTGTLLGTTFALVALLTATERRSEGARWPGILCITATALAMVSYEAMVGLPLLLLMLGAAGPRFPAGAVGGRGVRRVLLGLLPLYFVLRRALGTTDLSLGWAFPKDEVMPTLFGDTAAYIARALGSSKAQALWFHGEAPLVASLAVVVAFLAASAWVGRRNATAWFGLMIAASFLGPPLLVRATVGVLNTPSYRQMYPALVGFAIVVAAAIPAIARPALARWVHAATAVLAVALAWYHGTASTLWGTNAARLGAAARTELRDVPVDTPVLWVGAPLFFPYSVTHDWVGRDEIYLLPPRTPDTTVELCIEDETRLIATTAGNLMARALFPAGDRIFGRLRLAQHALPVLTAGSQTLSPYLKSVQATVRLLSRRGDAVTGLAFEFDRPVRELALLDVRTDGTLQRLTPPNCPVR